jgi:CMP/dCMP kinase
MTPPNTITIDGPAASGKSTLGCSLARELGYAFLDTGIMYRAVTYAALDRGLYTGDEAAVSELAASMQIDVAPPTCAERIYDLLVDGQDITGELRRPDVEADVSLVSSYPKVRQAMTEQQRRIGRKGKVVMVGRDIGTVVLPDAELKIYLVASLEERARRRYDEKIQRGERVTLADIRENLRQRDELDSTREVAPLKPADDAVILNSDGMSIADVLAEAKRLIR